MFCLVKWKKEHFFGGWSDGRDGPRGAGADRRRRWVGCELCEPCVRVWVHFGWRKCSRTRDVFE